MLFKMAEEQKPESHQPEMPKHSGPSRRRGRRGGRGRRRPPISQSPRTISEPSAEPAKLVDREFSETEISETETPPPPQKQFQPKRRGSPLLQAADEVAEVIESLKQTLAQMEEVLELIENAERQKISDEREIESLRRALRQIHAK